MGAMPGMMPGAGQPGQPQDFNKLFLAEKENMLITPHNWDLENVEERLLRKYGKLSKVSTVNERKPKKELSVRDKIRASQQKAAAAASSGKRRH